MPQKIKKIKNGEITTINVVNEGISKSQERKLYEIDVSKKLVRVYKNKIGTSNEFNVPFEGFDKIPEVFSETSNSDDGTLDSLQRHIERYHYNGLIISKIRSTSIDNQNLVINYEDYKNLLNDIKSIKNRIKILKQRERSKFLKNLFPEVFSDLKTTFPSICDSVSKEIIDEEVLRRLEYHKLQEIIRASTNVVGKKYGKNLADFQKNIKVIANLPILKKAAEDLVVLMNDSKKKESDFSKYLISTFPLLRFDCVYLEKNLNLICAGARKTDFLMINSEGFADVFEIKTPKIEMLKFDKSHQNYYWSPDASMAIAQIEKYLHQAQLNSLSIKDSLSKKEINVDIIKPKGILIMGSDDELHKKGKKENSNKLEDFRILRSSLKNIEILTYSDLLRSLSNLVKTNEESSKNN